MDLSAEPEYKPKWRTNGTGLPGYQSGWFKLQNGQKALLFVADSRRVVFIPVRSGYSLLLSVSDAEQFLARLLAYRRSFGQPPQVAINLMKLAPEEAGNLQSASWKGSCLLRLWGAAAPGQPMRLYGNLNHMHLIDPATELVL